MEVLEFELRGAQLGRADGECLALDGVIDPLKLHSGKGITKNRVLSTSHKLVACHFWLDFGVVEVGVEHDDSIKKNVDCRCGVIMGAPSGISVTPDDVLACLVPELLKLFRVAV